MVKNITKLSEESKHSQADNTEKSQSTEVDIKVRMCHSSVLKSESLKGFNNVSIFMLFSAFRQPQLIQNAAARVLTKVNKVDHVSPGLSGFLCDKELFFPILLLVLCSAE